MCTHSLSQRSGKRGCWLFLRGRCLPRIGNFRSGNFFFAVYLYSYCYICLLFKQDWGIAAIPQYTKQPQLPRAPSQTISVMFSEYWLPQMEGHLGHGELTRTDASLRQISTVVTKSVWPHHIRCGFLLLLTYSVNSTFFFILCFTSL